MEDNRESCCIRAERASFGRPLTRVSNDAIKGHRQVDREQAGSVRLTLVPRLPLTRVSATSVQVTCLHKIPFTTGQISGMLIMRRLHASPVLNTVYPSRVHPHRENVRKLRSLRSAVSLSRVLSFSFFSFPFIFFLVFLFLTHVLAILEGKSKSHVLPFSTIINNSLSNFLSDGIGISFYRL